MKKFVAMLYVAVSILICLVPFAGMTVARTDTTTENKTLAQFPSFMEEEGLNKDFLTDLGEYFNDHFAFRQQFVSADAEINGKVLGVSTASTVLQGRGGWLFYTDTLDDYLGRNVLSDRGIHNLANNLRQVQTYVNDMGTQFLFTIAPNKNSLYEDYMPYYEKAKVSEISNIDKLTPVLEEYGINYLDLFSLFKEQDEVLYYKRDSHWNNKGAVLVYNAMMDRLQRAHDSLENCEITVTEDYIGDLNSMLYPLTAKPETCYTYNTSQNYTYVTPTESVEESWIQTVNEIEEDTLFMYRDSFGNTLLPLMANAYGTATFSKAVPYNISMHLMMTSPDVMIVEKVERNLDEFVTMPPVIEGEMIFDPINATELETKSTMVAEEPEANTMYWCLRGVADCDKMTPTSRILVRLNEGGAKITYEAYTTCVDGSDNGYLFYIDKENLIADQFEAEVLVETEDGWLSVLKQEVDVTQIETMNEE